MWTKDSFMGYVDARLQAHWKRARGVLSRHWKDNGGKTNPELARLKMKPHCREESWNHMCDYWELEKTRVCYFLTNQKSYSLVVLLVFMFINAC